MKSATRIIPVSAGAVVVLILAAALLSLMSGPASSTINADTLVSQEVATAPVLDGDASDAVWASAPATVAPVSGGWYGNGNVTMKSVYKDGMVYFLYQYEDPDMSLERYPWQKQADGSWYKPPATQWPKPYCPPGDASCEQYWSMKDPNGLYEDKMAVLWDVNTEGFATQGCAITCHWGDDRASGKYGRKYTNAPGEVVDMWHFKSVRTASVFSRDFVGGVASGQWDDQYIDDCTDPAACKNWGRHGDPKTGGGYTNNYASGGTTPIVTSPTQPADGTTGHPWWIMRDEETPFVDTYVTGDKIAAIRISPFAGDRASLTADSSYSGGVWTVETSRALVTVGNDGVTPSTVDVQFDDLDAEYYFGVAVFDNAQVEHSMSGGVYKLIFAECTQPALSLSKGSAYWASMADYSSGTLSVDMTITNSGTADAYDTTITNTVNTNGVVGIDPYPMLIGDIAGGNASGLTLQYMVPPGVVSYITMVQATAEDGCGNVYSY